MLLYVMRHGIAQDRDDPESPADPERTLTRKGVDRTAAAVRGLRALAVDPALVLTSPYRRAAQTAALVGRGLGLPDHAVIETDALLPDCAPAELFRELETRDAREVLCVGHAPGVDELLAFALGGGRAPLTALKKAGAGCVELESWGAPRGQLVWLLEPAALRALGRAVESDAKRQRKRKRGADTARGREARARAAEPPAPDQTRARRRSGASAKATAHGTATDRAQAKRRK